MANVLFDLFKMEDMISNVKLRIANVQHSGTPAAER